MFDRSRTRFHDKNWQKSGARFFFRSFDRVKTVALWSGKKIKRTIKGYGSAAMDYPHIR